MAEPAFFVSETNCEVCAPQAQRLERHRCQTHAMPEPDFDQIADRIVGRIDVRARGGGNGQPEIAWVVEQLRQVWNARGAADITAMEAPFMRLGPFYEKVRDEIKSLDR